MRSQYIVELRNLNAAGTEKNTKIMLSSFALLLWSIAECDDQKVLPDDLIDALLQYLSSCLQNDEPTQVMIQNYLYSYLLKCLFLYTQKYRGMGILDVPVFHILRQKGRLAYIHILKLAQILAGLLQQLTGPIRWASLLVLSIHASSLSDPTLLAMINDDLKFLKEYLCNFSDPCEVFHVFQSLLLLSGNRSLLIESNVVNEILCMPDVVNNTERKKSIENVLKLIHDAKPSHEVKNILPSDKLSENLQTALSVYISSVNQYQVKKNNFLALELCSLMSQVIERHNNEDYGVLDKLQVFSSILSFVQFLISEGILVNVASFLKQSCAPILLGQAWTGKTFPSAVFVVLLAILASKLML